MFFLDLNSEEYIKDILDLNGFDAYSQGRKNVEGKGG